MSQNHFAQVTQENPALWDLTRSWITARFSGEDGIGPMGSLHQAGDSLVAVAHMTDGGTQLVGSGVMVGPGLLLTATHVLDEVSSSGSSPLFLTFLPNRARAWLPIEAVASTGISEFHEDRKVKSDVSLVGCTLNSDARAEHPLMLAPLQVALPLVGERLWAFGFRHNDTGDERDVAGVAPLVSSGVVTAAFPHGRGERMPAACIEVAMDTWGGMSGGPVANDQGYVIGIVSSSFEGGPTYVTLIWDILRHSVRSAWPLLAHRANGQINLLTARDLGVVKLKGNVKRFRRGDLVIRMTDAEMQLMLASADPSEIKETGSVLNDDALDEFQEEHSREMEECVARAAIEHLEGLSVAAVREFLAANDIPEACLAAINSFEVEDFEGVEDLEIVSNRGEDGCIVFLCAFDLLSVFWTVEVPTHVYHANAAEFDRYYLNAEVKTTNTSMQALQRCYFEVEVPFHRAREEFSEATIKLTGVHRPRRRTKVD